MLDCRNDETVFADPAMSDDVLKPGDTVWWRGAWGREPARLATVMSVHRMRENGDKNDTVALESIPWSELEGPLKGCYIVDLSDDYFAYGYQISRYRDEV